MLAVAQFSQFYSSHSAFFILMNGTFLLLVTGILNLNTTAKMKFRWLFLEPLAFAAIVFVDWYQLVDRRWLQHMYGAYFGALVFRYIAFMGSVIKQTTNYLGIGFLTVTGGVTQEKKAQ